MPWALRPYLRKPVPNSEASRSVLLGIGGTLMYPFVFIMKKKLKGRQGGRRHCPLAACAASVAPSPPHVFASVLSSCSSISGSARLLPRTHLAHALEGETKRRRCCRCCGRLYPLCGWSHCSCAPTYPAGPTLLVDSCTTGTTAAGGLLGPVVEIVIMQASVLKLRWALSSSSQVRSSAAPSLLLC